MTLQGLVDPLEVVTVDVRRPVQTVGPGGQPQTTLAGSPVQIADADAVVSKLSGGEAERAFGRDSDATFQVTLDRASTVQLNDIIEVKSGRYTGLFLDVMDILSPVRIILCGVKETILV